MKESVQETLRLIRKLQNEPHQSGYRGFTDYYPGSNESRIIIAAPHGGMPKSRVVNEISPLGMEAPQWVNG